jgi:hypothetical protein
MILVHLYCAITGGRTMPDLPQPARNTMEIVGVTSALTGAVLDQLFPGIGTAFREVVALAVKRRIESGEKMLLEEVRRRGISALDDPKFDFFVPAYYRFLEQVRLGEYDHNLAVLAKLIAGELEDGAATHDVGRVGRAAQKLHLLSHKELAAVVRCIRIFDNPVDLTRDGRDYVLTVKEFISAPDSTGLQFDHREANQILHELSIRGLLTYAGAPAMSGAPGYYRNTALDEISAALRDPDTVKPQ